MLPAPLGTVDVSMETIVALLTKQDENMNKHINKLERIIEGMY